MSMRSAALNTASACASLAAAAASAAVIPDARQQEQVETVAVVRPASQPAVGARKNLLGDIGGLRRRLGESGITLGLTETSEVLGNVRGGLARGATYDGLTTMTLGVDMQKALGIEGARFNISALQIHGRSLSPNHLGTLNTASGIAAENATRLWEMWYLQALRDGRFDVRIGQQGLDQEFIVSAYSATFVNTMFGWPGVPSYDMPNGGPAYPLSALGVRARRKVTASLTALAGIFDADPLGNDPANRSGTNFNLHNGALFIAELQYSANQSVAGESDAARRNGVLPAVFKIGVWYNNARFADQRFDAFGLSLANPDSGGVPMQHRGNFSVYAVADQTIWRPVPSGPKNLGVFARVMGAPGDRNLGSASANLGLVLKAPFKGRDDDAAGLALAYIRVGRHARDLDRDQRLFNGLPYAIRSSETVVEATYQYQVMPWWQLQGDMQYTFNPGAGQSPNDPTQRLRNTLVIGARTTLTF